MQDHNYLMVHSIYTVVQMNEHVIFNSIAKLTVLYTGGTCIPGMGTSNSVIAG